MEQALEGADGVHRVKRGRPAKVAAVEKSAISVERAADGQEAESALQRIYMAEAYAKRVWDGQSVDLPQKERIERVLAALRGQNLPTDGLVFQV